MTRAERIQRVRAGARLRARSLGRARSIWAFTADLTDAQLWAVIRPYPADLAALNALADWLRARFARYCAD